MSFFSDYLEKVTSRIQGADILLLEKSVDLIKVVHKKRKKLIIVGNGGSAAIASHVAVDLTKNADVRAINFNEADLITCLANDYGYEHWVGQALDFYADEGDLLILISSSGSSVNIINAAKKAKEKGLMVITFSGFSKNNPLKSLGDLNFWVDSNEYNIVENTHSVWLLAVVDRLINEKKG